MRHRVKGRHLNRNPSHFLALKRNMVSQIIAHERIVTTVAKAKEMRGFTERLITIAKKSSAALESANQANNEAEKKTQMANALHYRRRLMQLLGGKRVVPVGKDESINVVEKLIMDLAPRYRDRHGGYTRVLKQTKRRIGDSAVTAIFELIPASEKVGDKKKKRRAQPAPTAADSAPATTGA